jgi:ABC-2 type transport system ATP-binding protein
MKQRFGIAQALLGDPKLIIVDEPTAGLDPGERNRFYNLLSEIGENRIVILSTHIVDDVKELCSNMAIIDKGTLLYSGSPFDALQSLSNKIWTRYITKPEIESFVNRYRVISTRMVGGRPLIHVYHEEEPGDGFSPAEADLEDVFFSRIAGLR